VAVYDGRAALEVVRGAWRLAVTGEVEVRCVAGVVDVFGFRLARGDDAVTAADVVVKSLSKRAVVHVQGDLANVTRVSRSSDLQICRVPKTWREAATRLLGQKSRTDDDDDDAPESAAVVVCGHQGAGKSTLCRYLANKAAGRHVFILDADPGQPLAGPPGFVSLRRVSGPSVLPEDHHDTVVRQEKKRHSSFSSPATTTTTTPTPFVAVQAHFLGDVTPRDNPTGYAAAVASLLDCFARQPRRPGGLLVVNTCGWIRGLGAEILATLLGAVATRPDVFVVGARSEAEWTSEHLGKSADVLLGALRRTDVAYLRETAKKTRTPAVASAVRRHDRLASHVASCDHLGSAPLSALSLAFVGGLEATPVRHRVDDAIATLPSALVGLAKTNGDPTTTSPRGKGKERGFTVVEGKDLVVPCHGLALVRAVDLQGGTILLQAPKDAARGCDLLLRGTLQTPPPLLYQPTALDFPYLSTLATGRPMRARANLQRGSR